MVKEVEFNPRGNRGRSAETPAYDENGNITPEEIKRNYYRAYYKKRRAENAEYLKKQKNKLIKGPLCLKIHKPRLTRPPKRPFKQLNIKYEVPLLGDEYDILEDIELLEQISAVLPNYIAF